MSIVKTGKMHACGREIRRKRDSNAENFFRFIRDVEALGGEKRACNFNAVESGKGEVIQVLL